jgi:DHA3 family tetracycline resistance protein-like MFS transporter
MILLPFFVEYNLQKSEDWYGFLVGFFFLGTFIGSIIAGAFRLPPQLRGKALIAAILTQSIGYAFFGFVQNEYLALGLAIINGIAQGFITVNILTIVQLSTHGEIRGRVLAILTTISNILVPLATLLAGIALDFIGRNVYLIFLVSGIVMTIFVIWAMLNSQFRSFLASDYRAEAEDSTEQENYDQQLDYNP